MRKLLFLVALALPIGAQITNYPSSSLLTGQVPSSIPQWYHYTVASTALTTAGTTQQVTLFYFQ